MTAELLTKLCHLESLTRQRAVQALRAPVAGNCPSGDGPPFILLLIPSTPTFSLPLFVITSSDRHHPHQLVLAVLLVHLHPHTDFQLQLLAISDGLGPIHWRLRPVAPSPSVHISSAPDTIVAAPVLPFCFCTPVGSWMWQLWISRVRCQQGGAAQSPRPSTSGAWWFKLNE